MAEESFDYISTIKAMLGITVNDYDSILQLYVDLTKQAILNYCNIFELPSALDYTLCQIVVDEYRRNNLANETGKVVGNVTKIEEDGRVVAFSESPSYLSSSIRNHLPYIRQLNRFKKLYRVGESSQNEGI